MRSAYYKVLQIPDNSSLQEVKKAYRRLAKKYHPDVSKEANAKEKFLRINEAYEFLINAPTQTAGRNARTKQYYERKERVYQEWVKNNEERIRNSAERKAKMSYSDWIDNEGFGSAYEFAFVKLFGCLFSVFAFGALLTFVYFILDLLGLGDTIGVGLLVVMIFLFLPCSVLLMTFFEEKKMYQKVRNKIKGLFSN